MEYDNDAESDRFKILAKMLGAEVRDEQIEETVITV